MKVKLSTGELLPEKLKGELLCMNSEKSIRYVPTLQSGMRQMDFNSKAMLMMRYYIKFF